MTKQEKNKNLEWEYDFRKWLQYAIDNAKDGSRIHIPKGLHILSKYNALEYSEEE